MFKEIIKKVEWNNSILELSTGKFARQADGAVLVKMGNSVVLCTSVTSKEVDDNIDFFPLNVQYREMAYSAGKIPGGFFKREGKPSEREILVSRMIDRPIRPLFPQFFYNETQVICTVLSYDSKYNTDILSIIGASAAVAISGAPYRDFIAASRVGLINDNFVLNPSFEMLKSSQLDLIVAGNKHSVMMVESESNFISEEKMLDAIKFGYEGLQPVIKAIDELVISVNKPKWDYKSICLEDIKKEIKNKFELEIDQILKIKSKQERQNSFKILTENVCQNMSSVCKEAHAKLILDDIKSDILRKNILDSKVRADARLIEEIRDIQCETTILPRAHGSSLFTRGETQALVSTTLGTNQDEQLIDSLEGDYKERFMLNYIFPSYSVGEVGALKSPGRREVGHGKLAWKALNRAIPNKEEFPYSIRVVSEITESNGSSSMATVCGASMSLMDSGVPIKESIAGIAMGLIKSDSTFVILSDISGDEDALGDMDFKVAGGISGITALQMDIKIDGVDLTIIKQALLQGKLGRTHILSKMSQAVTEVKPISDYAPLIKTFKIDKDKIREVIGPSGRVIRDICDTSKVKVDINDDGTVNIAASNKDQLEEAMNRIFAIVRKPEIGEIFTGRVVKILDSGIFVNYISNKDGFVHISEICRDKQEELSKLFKEGDSVKVKIIGFDNKGKAKLTMNHHNFNSPYAKTNRSKGQEILHGKKKYIKDKSKIVRERKYFN